MSAKRLIGLVLCAALLLSIPVMRPQAAPTDTVYVRKHVSLVYDNSGSMSMALDNTKNLKWTYASYAAQIFAGLLNDADSLTLTLMNRNKNTNTVEIDLAGDRQQQVDKIHDITNFAKGGTPYNSVVDAEQVLVKNGLLTDEQIGTHQISKSEQFWLVLTTDGNFDQKSAADVEADLEVLLKKYSNLQVVYFGIGTEGDKSDESAIDLRGSTKLAAYPNFTAVYAEKQEQIVSTMQELANRISGRYSVTNGIQFNGNEVTLRISGESSPVRNIALLAQRTDAKLLSAVDEDGRKMTVARTANEKFPRNSSYDNIAENTKGAHTALITCPDGKFPPGTVKLTFSEPVNKEDFSLMYEPAVYVSLVVQQKDASGQWVDVPYGQKVRGDAPMRVDYVICEDGTDTPIDAAKLPGMTTEKITCGDKAISRNGEFNAPSGTSNITATISLMDGAYTVSTVRSIQSIDLGDYTVNVSAPLEFFSDELATNTDRYIEFKVLHQGKPATADLLVDFSVDSGDLEGAMTTPELGVFRFTPKQADCQPGQMQVNLCFLGQSISSQTVTVKEMVVEYTAEAGENLTLFSNEVAGNLKPVTFTVTKICNGAAAPLPEEEAGDFRIEAADPSGAVLQGTTKFVSGQLHFIPDDGAAQPGEYVATLYRKDAVLASARIVILKYNAQYTAEVFRMNGETVDLFDLWNNESALAFVIYADGEACTGVELESMLGTMLLLEQNAPKSVIRNNISIGTYDNKAALIVHPTSNAKNELFAQLQKLSVAWNILVGSLEEGPLTVELTVQAEKGTQITGSLDMVYDPADYGFWLILLLVILALILITAAIVLANMATPKLFAGEVVKYIGHVEEGRARLEEDGCVTVRYRPRLKFLWTPEVHEDICGLKMIAEERNYFRRSRPICVFPVDENLPHYRYQYAAGEVQTFVRIIEENANQYFSWNTVTKYLNGTRINEDLQPGATECCLHIDDGALLKLENDGQIQIWVYYRGKKPQHNTEEDAL